MSEEKIKGKKSAIKKRKKMKKKLKAKRAMKLLKLHKKGKIKIKGKGKSKSKSKVVTREQQPVATAANLTSSPKQSSQTTTSQTIKREEPRKGSLLNAILSYVILASLAAGAVALYQNWNGIMGKVAGTVCSNSLLGSYITPNPMALRGTVEPNMVATIAPAKSAEPASVGLASVEPTKTEEAQSNPTMQTAWMDARRTFWKDGAAAETAYLDLVKNYPDQADIRGELGNIYFQTNRKEQAVDQYYKAGLSLIKSDNKERALSVIELLREMAPEKMQSLQEEYAKAG